MPKINIFMKNLFLDNKYTTWYNHIITSAKNKSRIKLRKNNPKYQYFEKHHIIPRSLNGTNDSENLVLLTPKEHYVCHLLLTKMCISKIHKNKMLYAFNRTSQSVAKQKINSSMYQKLRIEFSKMRSETSKGKLNNFYGKVHSQETKDFLSSACALFGIDNGFFGKTHSKEIKLHLSKIAKARKIQIPPPPQKGSKNHFSKYYKITFPDGHSEIIHCLKTFTETNNLCRYTIKIFKNKGIIPTLIFDRPYRVKNIEQKRNCEGYSIESISDPSGILPSIDQTVTGN